MKKILLVLISLNLCSCVFRHMNIEEKLGNGYYYIGAAKESQILYNEKGSTNSGLIVTEAEILEYNYNEKFIIAKSKTVIGDTLKFWIIDKTMEYGNYTSMNSNKFYERKEKLKINLKLKKRK